MFDHGKLCERVPAHHTSENTNDNQQHWQVGQACKGELWSEGERVDDAGEACGHGEDQVTNLLADGSFNSFKNFAYLGG